MRQMLTLAYFPGDDNRDPDDDRIDLMALAGTLLLGKWIILGLGLLGLLLAWYYAFAVAEPMYQATTQMAQPLDKSPIIGSESVMSSVFSYPHRKLLTEGAVIRRDTGVTQYHDVSLKQTRHNILRHSPNFLAAEGMLEGQSYFYATANTFAPDIIMHNAGQTRTRCIIPKISVA